MSKPIQRVIVTLALDVHVEAWRALNLPDALRMTIPEVRREIKEQTAAEIEGAVEGRGIKLVASW